MGRDRLKPMLRKEANVRIFVDSLGDIILMMIGQD